MSKSARSYRWPTMRQPMTIAAPTAMSLVHCTVQLSRADLNRDNRAPATLVTDR